MEVIVIGTGNLGYHLCRAIEKQYNENDYPFAKEKLPRPSHHFFLKNYYNYSAIPVQKLKANLIVDLSNELEADLVIIATPDDTILSISKNITTDAVVVHTSGSVSIKELNKHKNRGVLYFPQTFSKSRTVNFEEIPCCIEYNSDTARIALESLGSTLSRKQYHLNSDDRSQLHKAAIFMNNFVNHCYTISYELIKERQLDEKLLIPLMKETLQKALDIGSLAAQTGPARRGDQNTITKHVSSLSKNHAQVYQALTQSIIKTYGN